MTWALLKALAQRARAAFLGELRSWALLLMLGVTHYATPHMGDGHWYAWTSAMGLMFAVLFWFIRGPRLSMIWLVSMWGIIENLEVFFCQAAGVKTNAVADGLQGMCGKQLGLPIAEFGAVAMIVLCVLWLERNKRRDSPSRV